MSGVGIHVGLGEAGSGALPTFAAKLKELRVNAFRMDYGNRAYLGKDARVASLDAFIKSQNANGIKPILVLGAGPNIPQTDEAINDYVNFVRAVATRFKGSVHHYEAWNEPPNGNAWAFKLAAQIYPVLKSIDSANVLLGGVNAGINNGMTAAYVKGGGLKFADAMSLHVYPYQQYKPPNAENAIGGLAAQEKSAAAHMGGAPVDLVVTEIGFPTHSGPNGYSLADAASNLARVFLLASAPEMPYVKGVIWYDIADDGRDNKNIQHNFGVYGVGWTRKPAVDAMIAVNYLRATSTVISSTTSTSTNAAGQSYVVHTVKHEDSAGGTYTYAVWTETPNVESKAYNISDASPINVSGICADNALCRTESVSGNGTGSVSITFRDSPIFIKTKASDLTF